MRRRRRRRISEYKLLSTAAVVIYIDNFRLYSWSMKSKGRRRRRRRRRTYISGERQWRITLMHMWNGQRESDVSQLTKNARMAAVLNLTQERQRGIHG